MHVLNFENIWKDFYDRKVGGFNNFLLNYTNKNEGYSTLSFQVAQENYLIGVYLDFLAKLSKKNSTLIDEDNVKNLLAYDFSNIDEEILDYDKYTELSEFYLYRLNNNYCEDKYKVFSKDCSYLLRNKEGYMDSVACFLNNNKSMAIAYTNYLFDDIEKQKKSFKKTSERLTDFMDGYSVNEEDYKLLIDNYKRLYLKKRVYEDILPLCMDEEVKLNVLSANFNHMINVINGDSEYYCIDGTDSKENKPLEVMNDYFELSNKLDNCLDVITRKKTLLKK